MVHLVSVNAKLFFTFIEGDKSAYIVLDKCNNISHGFKLPFIGRPFTIIAVKLYVDALNLIDFLECCITYYECYEAICIIVFLNVYAL